MSDKQLAKIICDALLAIVVAIRRKYDLPNYHDVTILIQPAQFITTDTPARYEVSNSN